METVKVRSCVWETKISMQSLLQKYSTSSRFDLSLFSSTPHLVGILKITESLKTTFITIIPDNLVLLHLGDFDLNY